jgi:hypothetical protein
MRSGGSLNTDPQAATNTRVAPSTSRTASRIAAAEPAIALSVSPASSREEGTDEGPARPQSSSGLRPAYVPGALTPRSP